MHQNLYEINVAKLRNPEDKYGIHWCRIELPDWNEDQAKAKLDMLRLVFGNRFNITMTYWKCTGENKKGW